MNNFLFFCCSLLLYFTASFAGEPYAVYLTWQNNPCTTITIQWLTDAHQPSDQVEYHAKGEYAWIVEHGTHVPLPDGYNYFLHRLELKDLEPGMEYLFRIPSLEKGYKFKTLPKDLSEPLSFIVGGDIYHDHLWVVSQTNVQAAKKSPAFALLGGDISYASSRFSWIPEEKQRWLDWLALWTKDMVTPEGYLIPLIPTIGNHDCKGSFYQTAKEAAFFYTLFPFPGTNGCNVLDVGNYLSLFVLDSAIAHPIEGEQTEWLEKTLLARESVSHKFALYHVPAYPSVRDFNYKINKDIRKNWVPLFEKYQLTAGFENHEHAYKRTYPLKAGKRDPNGVLYLGDGAWGVIHPRIPKKPSQAWYIAKSASVRHIIFVTLEANKRKYQAIDFTGKVIDEYAQ